MKIKITICFVLLLFFVGSIFAEELTLVLETDVNLDGVTNFSDFAEFAKYWDWKDLREVSLFETFSDYEDFWDPNNPQASDFDSHGQNFDFNGDAVVDAFDLFFLLARNIHFILNFMIKGLFLKWKLPLLMLVNLLRLRKYV